MSERIFYTKTEAAAILGVSERTLDRLRLAGRISYHRNPTAKGRGRCSYSRANLDEYLTTVGQARTVAPVPPQPLPVKGTGRKRPLGDLSRPAL
jgi:hypothetical protein